MVPSPTMDDAHSGSITTTASEDWGQALIFQDDWNRMLLTCPYVHTRSLQPRPLLLAAGYVTELPFVILRQWAYVGVQKRFFRLEMGTDGNWFLYPENKSLQQMWVTVVHLSCPRGSWMEFLEVREAQEQPAACRRDLQEIPTAQTGQLRTKIQPETSKGYPDTVRPPWSQPWEQRMPIFYKCRIEQRVFFISLQVQRSSEDATNPIILKEHEGFYAGNSLSIDHHFHQQLFIPSSHQ